jgi:putative ABC transport system permease protein
MVAIFGADDGFQLIQGGEMQAGRWFTRDELDKGTPVIVLQEKLALKLFGREQIIGRWVRVGDRPVEVIGLWQAPGNIFSLHRAPR